MNERKKTTVYFPQKSKQPNFHPGRKPASVKETYLPEALLEPEWSKHAEYKRWYDELEKKTKTNRWFNLLWSMRWVAGMHGDALNLEAQRISNKLRKAKGGRLMALDKAGIRKLLARVERKPPNTTEVQYLENLLANKLEEMNRINARIQQLKSQ